MLCCGRQAIQLCPLSPSIALPFGCGLCDQNQKALSDFVIAILVLSDDEAPV